MSRSCTLGPRDAVASLVGGEMRAAFPETTATAAPQDGRLRRAELGEI
ncbi:hypothetical protein [Halobacterium noricense]|nr:hypothetical protein [Halobacterium noricense]UHH24429.1 hypothetical protein LT974_10555 [Halobacterium noricense]